MAPYVCSGKSCSALQIAFLRTWGRANSKAPVLALRTPPADPIALAHNVFRGLGHNLASLGAKAASRMRSVLSKVAKTAGGSLACYTQPAVVGTWDDDLTATSTVCNDTDLPTVVIVFPGEAALKHKTAKTPEAKHQEQLYDSWQLQGDQADAVADRSVSGWGVGSAAVCISGNTEQPSYFGYLNDSDFYDNFLGQQVTDSSDCQLNGNTEAGVDCLEDAFDGVDEREWQALLADSKMAAVIAELQARAKAC